MGGYQKKHTSLFWKVGLFRLFGLLILWFSVRLLAFFVFPGWSPKCHSTKTLTYKIATARPVSQASRPKKTPTSWVPILLRSCQSRKHLAIHFFRAFHVHVDLK